MLKLISQSLETRSMKVPGAISYVVCFVFFTPLVSFAQNKRAIEDGFDLLEDGQLIVDKEFGVLTNDILGDGNARAVLRSEPKSGEVDFRSDGSFVYTPNINFNGEDSFSYSFQSQPSTIEFTVDESKSTVDFSAELTALGLSQTRSDNSALEGTLQVELSPTESPFESIRIVNASLILSDNIRLNYRFFLFVTAEVSADGGDVILDLSKPGPVSTVSNSGEFSQKGNEFQVTGNAEVSASLDLGVPDGPQTFDTIIEDIDLDGTITESNRLLTLRVPVSFQGSFDISGNTIDLEIDGTLIATAPKPDLSESNISNVILEVDATNDAPNLSADYFTIVGRGVEGNILTNDLDVDGDPIIPYIETEPSKGTLILKEKGDFDYIVNEGSSGMDTFTYAVDNANGNVSRNLFFFGSEWSYLDNGTNPGLNWADVEFGNESWSKGSGSFGYGNTIGINTNISYGPSRTNKYVTTYFRKTFRVEDTNSINSFVLNLDRTDSCSIYLNGNEVYRDDNLRTNASYRTLASNDLLDEDKVLSVAIPVSLLTDGQNTLAVEVHKSSRSSEDFKFDISAVAIIPPFTELVSSGDLWKYRSNAESPPDLWNSVSYNDDTWVNALSPLGYGQDEVNGLVSFGNDPSNKYTTYYFRKTFKFTGLSDVVASKIALQKDDGVAVYLNGVEIARDNLQPNATHTTFAENDVLGSDELQSKEYFFDSALLREGDNVIAAEVHQIDRVSSDLYFDLNLLVSSKTIREFVYIQIPEEEAVDSDGDGYNDSTEIFFGSLQDSRESVPEFETKIKRFSDDVNIMFPGKEGDIYQFQISYNLKDWISLKKLIIGEGKVITETVPYSGVVKVFYRIIKP